MTIKEQLENEIEKIFTRTDSEELQRGIAYLMHKYGSPYCETSKGLSIIKPLIPKYFAGDKMPQKELELLFMLVRPEVDVDLFPNEIMTINNIQQEIQERFDTLNTTDEIMELTSEYLFRGLLQKNPLYVPDVMDILSKKTNRIVKRTDTTNNY